jgi:hypothetical protein
MEMLPRVLIGAGALLVLFGLLFWAAQAAGLGRLPGDIVIDRPHVKIAFPIVTSLLVSIILTAVLSIALRLWR